MNVSRINIQENPFVWRKKCLLRKKLNPLWLVLSSIEFNFSNAYYLTRVLSDKIYETFLSKKKLGSKIKVEYAINLYWDQTEMRGWPTSTKISWIHSRAYSGSGIFQFPIYYLPTQILIASYKTSYATDIVDSKQYIFSFTNCSV